MVSVPPNVLESIAFNLCSLHDFDPAFVHQNEKFALATITEYLRAQPAAAPVREEGGAVDHISSSGGMVLSAPFSLHDEKGLISHSLKAVRVLRTMLAARDLSAGVQVSDDLIVDLEAALATREEAPAEAGENWPALADLHTIRGWLYGLSAAPDLTDVVADGGVSIGDCYQQEAREFAGRIERIINVLRAQPPAREDGGDRPIEASWTDGVTHAYVNLSAALSAERQAWRQKLGLRIASVRYLDVEVPPAREDAQLDTDCVSLLADLDAGKPCGPEAAATIRSLIRERDTTPPASEAEKLRVAVEALTRTRRLVAEASESGFSDPDTVRALFVNNGAITQALAALQTEQKGGAA